MWENLYNDTDHMLLRRYESQIFKMSVAKVGTAVFEKIGVPKRIARWAPAVVITALHVRGTLQGTYKMNLVDWTADAWMVTIPNMPVKFWPTYFPTACLSWP